MIQVNEYSGGRVKSLGAEYQGGYFTAGIMLPGDYEFSTEKEEHIIVTLGELEIRVPGRPWEKYSRGETAMVPAKAAFQLRVQETVSYVCLYK